MAWMMNLINHECFFRAELQNEAKQTITKDIQPALLTLKKFIQDVSMAPKKEK